MFGLLKIIALWNFNIRYRHKHTGFVPYFTLKYTGSVYQIPRLTPKKLCTYLEYKSVSSIWFLLSGYTVQ